MSRQYKAAEYLLYTYPVNLMRRREVFTVYTMLKTQTDIRAQKYTQDAMTEGRHSDPAAEYVDRLMKLERMLAGLEGKTRPISELREELSCSPDKRRQEMRQVMELYYFDRWEMKKLAEHMKMNRRTLYRRREELVYMVMEKTRGG